MELLSEARDPRMDFLQEFTLKSLRLKPDKWSRMVVSDEQRNFINNFIERTSRQVLSFVCVFFYVSLYGLNLVSSVQGTRAHKKMALKMRKIHPFTFIG